MEDAFCGAICGVGVDKVIEVIGYIWKYNDLVESLVKDLESLDARHSTVKKEVDYYKVKQRRVIREDVTLWIQRASESLIVAKEFMQATEKNATGCCGQDFNWGTRYLDAKKAENHAEEIGKQTTEGGEFDKVYFMHLDPEPMAGFWADGYVSLPSMDETIEQLKCFLRVGGRDDKFLVGIYGVEGVGKTTLAKKFAADMESAGGVKVVLTNGKYGAEIIQTQIAERVGFEFISGSVTERAGSLYTTLSAMKVLIIFDDVDQKIDLSVIGIPEPRRNNGCRILVVSTSSKACVSMHSRKNLDIKPLNQQESKTFAAGFAIKKEWSEYSSEYISYNESWLPAEIERRMVYESIRRTKSISYYFQRAVFAATAFSSPKKVSGVMKEGSLDPLEPLLDPPLASTFQSAPLSSGGGTNTILLDADALDITHKDIPQYWTLVRSESSVEAVLIQVWFLNIDGYATRMLPKTNYGAYFVYQLSDNAKGFNINPVEMIVGKNVKRCYLDPTKCSTDKPTKREDKWLEIEMGIFYSNDYAYSPVKLTVQDHDTSIVKSGLRINGIELRQIIATSSRRDEMTTFLLDADALEIRDDNGAGIPTFPWEIPAMKTEIGIFNGDEDEDEEKINSPHEDGDGAENGTPAPQEIPDENSMMNFQKRLRLPFYGSFGDAAVSRIAQGIKVMAEGGYEKVFRQTFETTPEEQLKKYYACYLSTSVGPLIGTMYLSSAKLAFCSDNPLQYQDGDKTESTYYKIVIPLNQLTAVNTSKNTSNPAEKYIQIITDDNHEFWLMGFVSYDSAVRNLQEATDIVTDLLAFY